MRRASLVAGLGILLVGLGALALVRPWGLRLPRWLVIIPALAGSAYAASHALTAYVTKPLHALGIIHLEFDGWASRDETAQFGSRDAPADALLDHAGSCAQRVTAPPAKLVERRGLWLGDDGPCCALQITAPTDRLGRALPVLHPTELLRAPVRWQSGGRSVR